MINVIRTLLGTACALAALSVLAAAETPAYREPSDMTVEERTTIMQRMNDYNTCVYKESMARVDALPDIRQAADEAMTACQGTLDTVQTTIKGYHFSPEFAEQFLHHTQNRAVKMLIPELSLRKGGQ